MSTLLDEDDLDLEETDVSGDGDRAFSIVVKICDMCGLKKKNMLIEHTWVSSLPNQT